MVIHSRRKKVPDISPWTVHFSNTHTRGSLARVLRAFQQLKIDINRVNVPWQSEDLDGTERLAESRPVDSVYFNCTNEKMELISGKFKDRIKLKKVTGSECDGEMLLHAELQYPQESEGGLLDFLEFFAEKEINLRGLNTALMIAKKIPRNNNYITCKCSRTTVAHLKDKLNETEGVDDVIIEPAGKPAKTLKVYVQDGVGNLNRILKVFEEKNTKLTWINESFPVKKKEDNDSQNILWQRHDVEGICNEDVDREELRAKLLEYEASNIVISEADASNHIQCEVTVKDETGSLAKALQAFTDFDIEVIGINTRSLDKTRLMKKDSVHYLEVDMKCATSEEDKGILKMLKDVGFVEADDVQELVPCGDNKKTMTFSVIDNAQILAAAYERVTQNINSINDLSLTLRRKPEPVEVVYREYEFVFSASDELLRTLKSALNATCLVSGMEQVLASNRESQDHQMSQLNVSMQIETEV